MFNINSLLPDEKITAQQGEERSEYVKAWSDAIRHGRNADVGFLMQEDGLSANFQANAMKTGPLKYLLTKDDYPDRFVHQQIVAQQLIEGGAELSVPDHRGMIPADYAVLSNNKEAGSFVIIETMRHMHQKGRSYEPNFEKFFAVETDMKERQRRFSNIYSSCNLVAKMMQDLKDSGDPDFANIKKRDIQAWEDRAKVTMHSMPLPSPDLIKFRNQRDMVRETPVSEYDAFKDMPANKRPSYGRLLEVAGENVGLEEFRAARNPRARMAGLKVD